MKLLKVVNNKFAKKYSVNYFKVLNEVPKEDTNYILGKGPDREERLQKLNHVLTSFVAGAELKNRELLEENSNLKDEIIRLKNQQIQVRQDYQKQTEALVTLETKVSKSESDQKGLKDLYEQTLFYFARSNSLYLKKINQNNVVGAFHLILENYITVKGGSKKESFVILTKEDPFLRDMLGFFYDYYGSNLKFLSLDVDKIFDKMSKLDRNGNEETIRLDDKIFTIGEKVVLISLFVKYSIRFQVRERDGTWNDFDMMQKFSEMEDKE